jgi:hypothetical protein
MLDVDTFLTTLYVIVDDFCHSQPPKRRPGPEASLSKSEVLTLAIFARWSRFNSERDFYRYADTKLLDAFPTLPDRSQFNRLMRSCTERIEAFALHLASLLTDPRKHPYQALDSSAMPIRDCKRRGRGWLAGYADIGWSNSLGWYEGFCLLTATDPSGVITGFCFGAASTSDQPLAETFFTSSTSGPIRIPGSKAWAWPSLGLTLLRRASRVSKTTGAGWRATVQMSSIRPSATPAREAGPNA